ncbi:sigma-70 family RNA polymerase sigma factor [Noviherbaspirillum autotrophicum]|uniref:RNA polymerase sigma24 factor n=1 Tax=Noviherbaspirillum autotrophicum TaxID=709839 RepID=A0A0C2BT15_9BURK|nr:sigma-70 family RNA polymerase sigma factor [Noviherbaspirillum autotrophicum]KIF81196.1 RNA polymerase sigma24 factor [Noviherbaspirillum autotrophicum]
MRTLAHLDDMQCAILAQRGDSRAFSELVARYQDRIYRFLLRLVRTPEDASELTQDTFLRAYQGLNRWRPDAQFKTWLFRIARNGAFDLLRRDKVVEFVELDDDTDVPDAAAGPEAIVETAQRYRMLEAALLRLPAEHREILLLREIEDMSYEHIADVLDLNIGTVKSRIARARAALLDIVRHQTESRR